MKTRNIVHMTTWLNSGNIITEILATARNRRVIFHYANPDGIGNDPGALRVYKLLTRKNSRFTVKTITGVCNTYSIKH